MKEQPGGFHIVLETTFEDVGLLAIRYKYNKTNIMGFIAIKGAGYTQPGIPYIAKQKDKSLKESSREVSRPQIVSKVSVNPTLLMLTIKQDHLNWDWKNVG